MAFKNKKTGSGKIFTGVFMPFITVKQGVSFPYCHRCLAGMASWLSGREAK